MSAHTQTTTETETSTQTDADRTQFRRPVGSDTGDDSKIQACPKQFGGCGRTAVPYVSGRCKACGRPVNYGRDGGE